MAKKPNYDFEKRKKEMDRAKKKADKREERLLRKRAAAESGQPEPVDEPDAEPAAD